MNLWTTARCDRECRAECEMAQFRLSTRRRQSASTEAVLGVLLSGLACNSVGNPGSSPLPDIVIPYQPARGRCMHHADAERCDLIGLVRRQLELQAADSALLVFVCDRAQSSSRDYVCLRVRLGHARLSFAADRSTPYGVRVMACAPSATVIALDAPRAPSEPHNASAINAADCAAAVRRGRHAVRDRCGVPCQVTRRGDAQLKLVARKARMVLLLAVHRCQPDAGARDVRRHARRVARARRRRQHT